MVNSSEFSARLKQLIEHLGLAAAAFAQRIDVNRSSISHLLSGRNKPSLDVIIKIIEAYPEVDLYWLLNGKGEFPSKKNQPSDESFKENILVPEKTIAAIAKQPSEVNSQVDRIVIFYTDGSFKSYQNQ